MKNLIDKNLAGMQQPKGLDRSNDVLDNLGPIDQSERYRMRMLEGAALAEPIEGSLWGDVKPYPGWKVGRELQDHIPSAMKGEEERFKEWWKEQRRNILGRQQQKMSKQMELMYNFPARK